ncbi:lysylphosphatidylglycerol synthase domain-containing protein [Parasediminibacterium paludis]|uniref:Lysylphosphatidylglycerol synthase domain-containing protein n=1 Tax=Parasediminibacterium paludis TaxID=908966 RepID=A0ABV8PW23_9BACT
MWLSWSIYHQIQQQKGLQQSWQTIVAALKGSGQWRLYAAFALMFCNWGLEAKKWQVLMQAIQPLSYGRSFRAIFSGQALASSTPNRVGEFVGRIVYLNDGNRLRALSLSAVGSFAQIIITFVMGLLGLLLVYPSITDKLQSTFSLSTFWINWLVYAVSLTVMVQLVCFYNLSWITNLIEKIPFVSKYRFYIQKLEDLHNKQLTNILFLSFIRYVVYMVQYLLLFQLFQIEISWWVICSLVCVQLMVMAVVPSIALAELGVRGQVSIALFGLFSSNTIGIIAAVSGIWLINLIVPALAGSLLILGIKIFRK